MPRVRSQYIAEMRERFEVVDRVKASAEEKASLTKAIQEDEVSSPEVSPSKENTLKVSSRYKINSPTLNHNSLFSELIFRPVGGAGLGTNLNVGEVLTKL